MHRFTGEVAVDDVDHEGRHRSHEAAHGGQHLVEGVLAGELVGGLGTVPQAASASADVPVGQVVDDEILQFTAGLVVIPCDEALVVGLSHGVEPGEDPAVQRGSVRDVHWRRSLGIVTVQCGIIGMELVDVPQGEEHLRVGLTHAV